MTEEPFIGIPEPADLKAEQAILGAMLIDTEAIDQVVDILKAYMLFRKAHALVFETICGLYEDGHPIDFLTVADKLVERGVLEEIGGVSYLSELAGAVPTTANVESYVEIVRNKYILRQGINAGMALIRQAAASGDPNAVIAGLQTAATRLSDIAAPAKEYSSLRDVLVEVFEDAESRYINRDQNRGITGVPSGFTDLDRMTAGFQKSDLIIVAARPSVGKTAFALNIAQNVAKQNGEPVAVFSLEMGEKQLVQRMVSAEASVDAGRLRTGYFVEDDWEKMTMAIGMLADANLFIVDRPALTVHEIRAICRRIQKEHGLGLVVIDYMQLIAGRGKSENRQQEVSEISRILKQIARELDVPVIALSQLSRGVEQRQDKRPLLSDLRESGSIEQDADIVAFLYRDDYYDKESEKKNVIEIIIAKQRNGPVGTVELAFLKHYNKFVNLNLAHAEQPVPPQKDGKIIPDMWRYRG